MNKKLNTIEKKLKFHCSTCQTTWQLLVIRNDLLTSKETKCLNNCLEKWQSLLIDYCQEQTILDFARKEQEKDKQKDEIADWINQLKNNSKK